MPRDVFHLAFRAGMSAEGEDTGELMLYGEIVQDYSKYYKEQYPNDKSATDFDKAIKELRNKGAKRLKLRINSPGGIVTEAVAMRGILTGAGFEEINIRIEGMCASAATILASIPDAHVVITPGSEYMIHNPWTIAWGNANDMEKTVNHLRQLEATSRAFYAQKSGQADEQIERWMNDETWFTAEDAVKYGFCDEVAQEEIGNALPAAACVTGRELAVMRELYRQVPESIRETQDGAGPSGQALEAAMQSISNAAPVAGAATEIHHHEEDTDTMDIRELKADQLRAENPALYEQIRQDAVREDRQRQEDIDAITPPVSEYEQMAAEAKRSGTSAMDFHRQLVAAMRQRGANYLRDRTEETAPAQNVTGGASEDDEDEENQIKDYARSVATYAKAYAGGADNGMY